MDVGGAERNSRVAGIVTGITGAGLLLAPERLGPLAGVDDPRLARLIGLADLVLAPGLVAGRPRWPWMAARGMLNVVTAAGLGRLTGTSGRVTAATLLGLTVIDARAALTLRRAGR